MLLSNELWNDEWFCSLEQRQKLLYIYLLCASTKCGIFELNMRKINFDLNNGTEKVEPYTKEEVLSFGGNRIKKIGDNKAIITHYIFFNWCKNSKSIDVVRNPLFKSIVQELSTNGLTIADVNRMSKKKIELKEVGDERNDTDTDTNPDTGMGGGRDKTADKHGVSSHDINVMFDSFWKEYPGFRKKDKAKCHDMMAKRLREADDAVKLFNDIMNGLARWKASSIWTKDGGQFICAPSVWLGNDRWSAEVPNGNTTRRGSANANYKVAEANGIF